MPLSATIEWVAIFYGDRSGTVACPYGYRWSLAAAKEVVSPAEMQKRWSEMLEGGKVE